MKTETIALRQGGGNLSYAVSVSGLGTLMRFLKDADPAMRKAIQEGLGDAAQPVLARARANARRIADDGTFAASMSVRAYSNGSVRLRSNDAAGGVKEFANVGARTVSSKGTPLANARMRKGSGVGVPRRANPPRAMVPAVNDSVEEVKGRIEARLEEVLGRADG